MWSQLCFNKISGCHKLRAVGISLVVQWLRLHAPNSGGLGSVPDRGTRSHMPQLKILHAANKDLACHN